MSLYVRNRVPAVGFDAIVKQLVRDLKRGDAVLANCRGATDADVERTRAAAAAKLGRPVLATRVKDLWVLFEETPPPKEPS